jgi:hypothetical protein
MAQQSGSIVGTVVDKNGAFIANAQVTLTNTATKDVRHTTTNGEGFFALSGTAAGDYTVKVESQGFRVAEQTGIHVSPGDRRNLNVTLAIATATESVTVTADVSGIVVDSGDLSSTLNSNDINHLSLQGRDVTELLKTLPGFSNSNSGIKNSNGYDTTVTKIGSAMGDNLNAPGVVSRSGGADLLSDGAHILDPGCACNATQTINPDMVSEVKVTTSSYSADGSTGPVVVSAVGKSGTSSFHGGAYMHLRHHVLNSNDWEVNDTGLDRPTDRYYYPGGQLSGPVPFTHKKLFFFTGFEYYNQSYPDSSGEPGGILKAMLPTESERAGHFDPTLADNAAVCGAISSGNTGYRCQTFTSISTASGTVSGIVNEDISAYIAAGAKAWMKVIPEPNVTPTSATSYNYAHLLLDTNNGYMYHAKADYNFSDSTKLQVSYNQQHDNNVSPMMRWWYTANEIAMPGSPASLNTSRTISGSLVKVFNATTTNEFLAGLGYMNSPNVLNDPKAFDRTALGYPYTYPGTAGASATQMPSIMNSWYSTDLGIPQMMDTDMVSYFSRKMLPSVSDNFTKVLGTHTVKAGASWMRSGNRQATVDQTTGKNGTIQYSPIWDGNDSSKNPVLDLMLDHVNAYTYRPNTIQDMAETSFGFYGQDEWKVNKRLTVNFGLRVQHETPWVDTTGKTGAAAFKKDWYNADLAAGVGVLPGVRWHATDSSVPMAGHSSDSFNYGPRFGVAYDPFGTGKTFLRGGFGSYYYHDNLSGYDGAVGTAQGGSSCGTNGNEFLSQVDAGKNVSCANTAAGVGDLNAVDPTDHVEPYTYTYNFTVSQQVLGKSLLEITYSGSQSSDLMIPQTDINVTPIGAYAQKDPNPEDTTYYDKFVSLYTIKGDNNGSKGYNIKQDWKPYTHYKKVSIIRHGGWANYNALMVSLSKRRGAFNYNLNYTWSKALGISQTPDPVNFENDYGIMSSDRTQVFNSSYSYEVGKRFKSALLNDWMISGITILQSGMPIQKQTANLNFGGTTSQPQIDLPNDGKQDFNQIDNLHFLGEGDGTGYTVMPILTCNPAKGLVRSAHEFINSKCFALPTLPTFDANGVLTTLGGQGQYGWPYLRGPKYFSSDLSVSRTFKFTESQNAQIKLTGMNFLNHALWSFDDNNHNNYYLQYTKGVLATSGTGWAYGVPNEKFGRRVLEVTVKYNF